VAHLEVREIGLPGQRVQGYLALLHAAFQVVDHQRGLFHVLDVELGLRAGDLQAKVEPFGFGDVQLGGEAGATVKLPVQAGVEHGSVLHGVGQAGLVRAQIDPFGVAAVVRDAELHAEESLLRRTHRRGHVDVDDRVAHLEILEHGRAAVEQQAFAALIFGGFGLAFEVPAWGVWGYRQGLRGLWRG